MNKYVDFNLLPAKEKISRINDDYFFTEPLLFQILCTHNIQENRQIDVPFRSGKGCIEYNPVFLKENKYDEISSLYKRELIRILLKHPYQRKPEPFVGVIAYLASNITIEQKKEDLELYNLMEGKHFEYYYYELLNSLQNNGDGILILDKSDIMEQNTKSGAGIWEEDSLQSECINNIITDWIENDKSWGTISNNSKEMIEASVKARIDYRNVLKSFRASIICDKRKLTRLRPSRRFGFYCMGSKYDFCTKLLLAVDTSESISNRELEIFFGVIDKFFKYGIEEVDVINFDSEITAAPLKLKGKKAKFEITGRGGTNFQPVFDFVEQHPQYDGCIIFTDGYAPEPEKKPGTRTKFVWVCTTESEYNSHYNWMKKTGKCCFLIDN